MQWKELKLCREGTARHWSEHWWPDSQVISCVQGNQGQKERKGTGGKTDFCYIFVVLGEKKEFVIWLRKLSMMYSTVPT